MILKHVPAIGLHGFLGVIAWTVLDILAVGLFTRFRPQCS